jgi:hypothetical protein
MLPFLKKAAVQGYLGCLEGVLSTFPGLLCPGGVLTLTMGFEIGSPDI